MVSQQSAEQTIPSDMVKQSEIGGIICGILLDREHSQNDLVDRTIRAKTKHDGNIAPEYGNVSVRSDPLQSSFVKGVLDEMTEDGTVVCYENPSSLGVPYYRLTPEGEETFTRVGITD